MKVVAGLEKLSSNSIANNLCGHPKSLNPGEIPRAFLPIYSVALNLTLLCRTPIISSSSSNCGPNMTFFCCSCYFHKINLFSTASWLPILHLFLDLKLILMFSIMKKRQVILNNLSCIITKYLFMRSYLLY